MYLLQWVIMFHEYLPQSHLFRCLTVHKVGFKGINLERMVIFFGMSTFSQYLGLLASLCVQALLTKLIEAKCVYVSLVRPVNFPSTATIALFPPFHLLLFFRFVCQHPNLILVGLRGTLFIFKLLAAAH